MNELYLALGEDKTEFSALVQPLPQATPSSPEVQFMQQWQTFTPDQQGMMRKMMGLDKQPVASPSSAGSFFRGETIMVQEKPHLPTFSGGVKDTSYGRWKHEVACLETKHSEVIVLDAVRKSLKTPAADSLRQLGTSPTLKQIAKKMDSLYGSVLSGPAIMEKFYKESRADSSCAQWSIALEDWVYQAAEKNAIPRSTVPATLKHKFWSGLTDDKIKNALRHRYEDLDFEDLVAEARVIEDESTASRKSKVKSQQVTQAEDKLDLLIKKIDTMDAELKGLKEQQQHRHAEKRNGQVVCKKCNMDGHFSWGCKLGEDVECKRCRVKGHLAKACRNKKTLN